MKYSNFYLALIAFILLPSCMVTKSRYGNGIHIEMPQVFGKRHQSQNTKTQTVEKKNKKRIPSPVDSLDNSNSFSNITPNDSNSCLTQNDSNICPSNNKYATHKTTTTKTLAKQKKAVFISSLNEKNTPKNTQKIQNTLQSHGDNDMWSVFLLAIAYMLIAILIGAALLAIAIALLPPSVLVVLEIIFTIIGLICLLV